MLLYYVNKEDGGDVCEDCADVFRVDGDPLDGPFQLDAEQPGFTCSVCRTTFDKEEA
jgi:hypothetical protein